MISIDSEKTEISVRMGQNQKSLNDAHDLWALRHHCIKNRHYSLIEKNSWAQEHFQKSLSVNTVHGAIDKCRLKLYHAKKC